MRVQRGLLSTAPLAAMAVQLLAIDDFNELPARKREAARRADRLGHHLGSWHRRPNDPFGRWNAWCAGCGQLAVVAVEPPPNLAYLYGPAVTARCAR